MANIVQIDTDIQAVDWTHSRDALLVEAKAITQVTNEREFETAGEVQTRGTKIIKKLEAARKEVTSPIDDLKRQIMAKEKELRRDIEAEVARIRELTSAYATEQARKMAEEQARIDEATRKAAEAQVAAEAAQSADPFGFNAPAQPIAMPVIPVATVKGAHSAANRVVEKWDFQILDANAVPREFLSVDETKIRTFLSAKKAEGYKAEQIAVPGIKVSATMQVYSR